MLVTSISAAIGLIIMTACIRNENDDSNFIFLVIGRIFLGISQGFFDNYFVRMLEEFTMDNKVYSILITRFFVLKQLGISIGLIVSLFIYKTYNYSD